MIPAGTAMPRSIVLAEEASATPKAAFLLNAKEEFMEGEPTDLVDQFATVSLDAANEALRIAQEVRR